MLGIKVAIWLLFASFFFGNDCSLAAPKTITMSVFIKPEGSPRAKLLRMIYTEAFGRLGYQCQFIFKPMVRGSHDANNGLVDGEPGRRFDHNTKFQHLVRIDEPVSVVVLAAFTTRRDLKLHGWESLKGRDFRVDYHRGIEIIREKISPYVKPENIVALNSVDQALPRLMSGRTDLYIFDELEMQSRLQAKEYPVAIVVAGIMDEIPIYGFLHKKHQVLAADMAKIIRDMKREGLLEKFVQQVNKNNQ